jgi:hypothetical protein
MEIPKKMAWWKGRQLSYFDSGICFFEKLFAMGGVSSVEKTAGAPLAGEIEQAESSPSSEV